LIDGRVPYSSAIVLVLFLFLFFPILPTCTFGGGDYLCYFFFFASYCCSGGKSGGEARGVRKTYPDTPTFHFLSSTYVYCDPYGRVLCYNL
ncbi:hypothetical protein EDB84DRAFT_1492295, partial [Lactarius hengduanensis]